MTGDMSVHMIRPVLNRVNAPGQVSRSAYNRHKTRTFTDQGLYTRAVPNTNFMATKLQ